MPYFMALHHSVPIRDSQLIQGSGPPYQDRRHIGARDLPAVLFLSEELLMYVDTTALDVRETLCYKLPMTSHKRYVRGQGISGGRNI